MRLFEILTPTLYLKSKEPLKLGKVAHETRTCPMGAMVEGCLEGRRPQGKLPRDTTLALYESPNLNAEYVYAVRPLGQIDRHHTSWLKRLQQCLATNVGEMDANARGFWSGEYIPEDRHAPWEYRAVSAEVLKRVGGTARSL